MAKPLKLRQDSLQYVKGFVVADHDLNGVPVLVALPQANRAPELTDFESADVTDVVLNNDETYTVFFRILVGPGGTIEKGNGLYDWTVKLTDSPEAPVLKGGVIQITVT